MLHRAATWQIRAHATLLRRRVARQRVSSRVPSFLTLPSSSPRPMSGPTGTIAPTLELMSTINALKASLEDQLDEISVEMRGIAREMTDLGASRAREERFDAILSTLDSMQAEIASAKQGVRDTRHHAIKAAQQHRFRQAEPSQVGAVRATVRSKLEALPPELQLLIAEQLDYGSLKRLE